MKTNKRFFVFLAMRFQQSSSFSTIRIDLRRNIIGNHASNPFVEPFRNMRHMKTILFIDPLAREGDWAAYFDEENTGLVYYFNGQTGESMWTPPTNTFPTVQLTRRQLEVMQERNGNVNLINQGVAQLEDVAKASKGFFGSILEALKEGERKQKEAEEERAEVKAAVEAERVRRAEEAKAKAMLAKEARLEAEKNEQKVRAERERKDQKSKAEALRIEQNVNNDVQSVKMNAKAGTDRLDRSAKADKPQQEKTASSSNLGIGGLFTASKPTYSTLSNAMKVAKEVGAKKFSVPPSKLKSKPYNTTDPTFVSEDFLKDTGFAKTTASSFADVALKAPFKKGVPDIIVPSSTPLKLDIGSFVIASPEKVSWGGEDAVFVLGRSFGIFDGVSGAEKQEGVELYSRCLAQQMKELVGYEGLTLAELSILLLTAAEEADDKATGASTALIGSVGEDGVLRMLNVGDSTALVIREGRIVARTKEISHYFDCPYQLSVDSPDRPKNGTKLKFELMPGDILLLGSDGVFDNLSDNTICEIVNSSPKRSSFIVKAIAAESRRVSLDNKAPTPYAALAKRNRYEEYQDGVGGKVDDISCIAVVCN